ncbi:MAG: DHH family phosphoesterase, partial [bacterium]
MQNHKVLNIYPPNLPLQNILIKKLGISNILAQLLINRGITDDKSAEGFLSTGLDDLLDPFSFEDMHKAVGIIEKAARDKQEVMLFGDYDVDGITSLALLKGTLAKIGVKASHYIPHRVREGYGLSKNIVAIAKQRNAKLLVTVDCGTNSHREISELKRNNIEVIITDHHEQSQEGSSPACAIINPKLKGSGYKYRELAGVGVAYKLCQAITKEMLSEELDLVSLGTIA